MKKLVYKTYELQDVLDLYLNKNGQSKISNHPIGDLIEDSQIERDLLDDIDVPDNETEEALSNRIKRYQRIVKELKYKYGYKCQLCGYSFHMDNGSNYCEAHHIKMLSNDGSQSPENVIILCANHHRMFHYAIDKSDIGELIDNKRTIRIGEEEFMIQF